MFLNELEFASIPIKRGFTGPSHLFKLICFTFYTCWTVLLFYLFNTTIIADFSAIFSANTLLDSLHVIILYQCMAGVNYLHTHMTLTKERNVSVHCLSRVQLACSTFIANNILYKKKKKLTTKGKAMLLGSGGRGGWEICIYIYMCVCVYK